MPMQTQTRKTGTAGFTLIELMITVAIVGILATIAATSYQSQVTRSRRTDARNAVLDLAGREEKLFSTTNAYSQSPSDLGYGASGAVFPIEIGNDSTHYYNVGVQVPDPGQTPTTPSTYLITATAINSQVNDKACLTLSVNQLGQQTSTGTGTASTCWGH